MICKIKPFFSVITLLLAIFYSGAISDKGYAKIENETEENEMKEKDKRKRVSEEKVLGEMVLLSGGTFWMGLSEKEVEKAHRLGKENGVRNTGQILDTEMPRHKVTVKPYYIDKFEVTNQQFAQFVKEAGYKPQGDWAKYNTPGRESHPAILVTWYDAHAYAKWAGKRLPTEAEWEFAARGGFENKLFPWGDDISKDQADYSAKQAFSYAQIHTMEVGSYPPNSFGIYDMSGNAGEWCFDWFGENYYSKSSEENPTGPDQGEKMVVKGGAWGTVAFYLRASSRGSFKPYSYDYRIGFRCARSLKIRDISHF